MSTTPAETPLLRVNGLRKNFGEFTVFADMSFDLRHGRALAMVGPNGSGKSTAMRCITGAVISIGLAAIVLVVVLNNRRRVTHSG